MPRKLDKDIAKRLLAATREMRQLAFEIRAIEDNAEPVEPPTWQQKGWGTSKEDAEAELLSSVRNWYSQRFWIEFMDDDDSKRLRNALHIDYKAREGWDA